MSAHTNHQIVRHNGEAVAVVMPYDEYLDLIGEDRASKQGLTIPHEVMRHVLKDEKSLIAAWREHLKLTQQEVASRMGIGQATYARMERADANPRPKTIQRIADALGIDPVQLEG